MNVAAAVFAAAPDFILLNKKKSADILIIDVIDALRNNLCYVACNYLRQKAQVYVISTK